MSHELHVFDPQAIVGRRNPEATHFGRAEVSQEQQLRPRRRAEPQRRLVGARVLVRVRVSQPPAGFRPPSLGSLRIVHRVSTPHKSRGRVRFESDDLIRSLLIEPVPMQHDLKRSQADVFQRDRVGHDGDRVLFQIAVELTEFGLQGVEFVVHLSQVQQRFRRLVRQAVDLAATSVKVPRKNPHSAFEIPQQFFRRPLPTTVSGDE